MSAKNTNPIVIIACVLICLVALFFAGVGIYAGVEGISYGDALSNIFNGLPADSVETPDVPGEDTGTVLPGDDMENEGTIAADGSTEIGFTNLFCTAEFNVDNDGNIYFVTGANFTSADAINPAVVRYNPETKTQNIIGGVFTNISNDRYAMFKIAFDNTNTPYIVYKYDSINAMTYISYLDNNTKQWSTPESIIIGADPQICFDSEGNGYVAIVTEDDKIAVYTTKQ